jgi:uncharacterized protein (DUF486 family)
MQSNGTMLKMVTCEVTVDLNVFGTFMKYRVVGNLNGTLVITIQRSWFRNNHTHIIK